MILRRPLRQSTRPNPFACARCSRRAENGLRRVHKRGISLKVLGKRENAEADWQVQAEKIRKGEVQSMLSILEERGYINQITGTRKSLDQLLTQKRIGAYVGIDPTAPSLHVGHMIPLMNLFWMYVHGFRSVTLLGGATAKIGDPTDRTKDRERVHSTERTENMIRMHYQLKKLWLNVEHYGAKHGYQWEWAWKRVLCNNNTWLNKLSIMELLQTLGPGMRMGTMLSRDTVKNKMSSSNGMSYAEFTYPILQAWDWWHMYNTLNIQLQIGGSDQFGNIIAGIDAINYIRSNHPDPVTREAHNPPTLLNSPMGITTCLLTNSKGDKIGKSAGNALWLDGEMTSPFTLYGYWLRQPDEDVERYLKFFTFLPMDTIKTAVAEHMQDPKQRKGQHLLAREFVELIHGEKVAQQTEAQHRLMFSRPSNSPPDPTEMQTVSDEIAQRHCSTLSLNNAGPSPSQKLQLPHSLIYTQSIGKILHAAGLASSRSEGHRLATHGGAYVGGHPDFKQRAPMLDGAIQWVKIRAWKNEETSKFLIHDILTLRKGKNTIKIIQVVSDEDWEKSGKTYPGEHGERSDSEKSKDHGRREEKRVYKSYDRMNYEDNKRFPTERGSIKMAAEELQPEGNVGEEEEIAWIQRCINPHDYPTPPTSRNLFFKNKRMERKERTEATRAQEELRRDADERAAKKMARLMGKDVNFQPAFNKEKYKRREDAGRIMSGWAV